MENNPTKDAPFTSDQCIRIRGASEHNLKKIDLDIPRDRFIVVTGLSGSGKSTLAFDTIYAEGQRRYIESLSTYARQFLDQMQKPAVDSIEGLTPTISIEQRSGKATPRSTVATTTEIYDYLRVLYARAGSPLCSICEKPIQSQSPEDIVNDLLGYPENTRVQILSPLVREKKGEHREICEEMRKEGITRLRIDGEIVDSDQPVKLKKTFTHNIEAVIDRLIIREGIRARLTESIELALKYGEGLIYVLLEHREEKIDKEERYSERFACPDHGSMLEELSPRVFSFNSPFGSCPSCSGLGTQMDPAPDLVIPDTNINLEDGALQAWKKCGSGLRSFYRRSVEALAQMFSISVKTPWKKLPEETQLQILYGVRRSKEKGQTFSFEGVIPGLKRRFETSESEKQKARIHDFMTSLPCRKCKGHRLKPEVLAVKIKGFSIYDITRMTVDEGFQFFSDLSLPQEKELIARPIKKAILDRLGFLKNVGLNYLTLHRSTNTLSGGEAQRIRLAAQLGAKLVGVTYVLDEPTIGLHQRDNARLLNSLVELQHLGNTVIVVEHDRDVIHRADYLIDVGPEAGKHGGEIVAHGNMKDFMSQANSLTAQYLRGEKKIDYPSTRRKPVKSKSITIKGLQENNLQGIDVSFPLGLLICVTGVSGSGKSSLVNECLLKGIQKELNNSRVIPGKYESIHGLDQIDKVINIDQSPIGRTSRSNPSTYTGMFDGIRSLYSQLPEAKIRGYTQGRFSFNVKGGRCESCMGQGEKVIEMHFLPDVHVPCDTCHGSRYNRETLQVKFRGQNISHVLNMPIEEASEFFKNHTKISPPLKTLVDVGLGYIHLGQPSPTLSGGEAQRIKLAAELSKRSTGKTFYILDEPTTGLHFHDIAKLMHVLQRLVELGNTVVVIEHNLDVIKCADWVIDLGPEGGAGGGMLVATGTPEEVALVPESYTGHYLKEELEIS